MQRLTTGADPGAATPTIGPVAELHAHVAIVPMLRAGPYVAEDLSPIAGTPARQMTEGGLRLKFTPPLVHAPWHVWTFVGFGYARTYAPSYLAAALPGSSSPIRVPGAGGGILDMPLGIGIGVKLRRPWALFAELAGRVGWFFSGSMYEHAQCLCEERYVGKDSFAAALSVGVSLEQ
jgi:hypothetical protein